MTQTDWEKHTQSQWSFCSVKPKQLNIFQKHLRLPPPLPAIQTVQCKIWDSISEHSNRDASDSSPSTTSCIKGVFIGSAEVSIPSFCWDWPVLCPVSLIKRPDMMTTLTPSWTEATLSSSWRNISCSAASQRFTGFSTPVQHLSSCDILVQERNLLQFIKLHCEKVWTAHCLHIKTHMKNHTPTHTHTHNTLWQQCLQFDFSWKLL